MASKKTTTKKTTRKAPAKKAAAKKTAPAKATPADPAGKPNRVFAMRVTDAELAAIHAAAGPRNATRFVRAVATAFASGAPGAFRCPTSRWCTSTACG